MPFQFCCTDNHHTGIPKFVPAAVIGLIAAALGGALTPAHVQSPKSPFGDVAITFGVSSSQVQTTASSGSSSTTTGGTRVHGMAYAIDYVMPLFRHFGVGACFTSWSLPGAEGLPSSKNSAVAGSLHYIIDKHNDMDLFVGGNSGIGYMYVFGKTSDSARGFALTAKLIAPRNADVVQDLVYFGVGYRL